MMLEMTKIKTPFFVTLTIAALLMAALMLLPMTALATTYYVNSETGMDGPDRGTNTDSAFGTIQYAVDQAQAGDTIRLQGKYYRERVTFPRSGTAVNNQITIDGEWAFIDGPADLGHWCGVFELSGNSYITIKNCHIGNSNWFGIAVFAGSSNVTIDTNWIYNTGSSGIYVRESNAIEIKGNTVDNACNSTSEDDSQECISVVNTGNFHVHHNTVQNVPVGYKGGEGIDAKEGSHDGEINNNTVKNLKRTGIYVDAWDKETYRITVADNTVDQCRHGVAVSSEYGGTVWSVTVRGNTTTRCEEYGIVVTTWGEPGHNDGPRWGVTLEGNWIGENQRGLSIESWNVSDIVINGNHYWNNAWYDLNVVPSVGPGGLVTVINE